MNSDVVTTITLRKKRIEVDQRMLAKELLLAHFAGLLNGGQLIIHFGPGRVPVFVEIQEREDHLPSQLQKSA